jgi:hypothetical protein
MNNIIHLKKLYIVLKLTSFNHIEHTKYINNKLIVKEILKPILTTLCLYVQLYFHRFQIILKRNLSFLTNHCFQPIEELF